MNVKNNPPEALVLERTFDAPVTTVWKALTNVEDMRRWYFDLKEFRPEPGFEFQFVVEHEGNRYDHRCKVTEVVPQKKVAYTWRYHGHEGDSLVTFELFAEGEKTRLKLTHEGLETFPNLPSFARKNFEGGWTSLIGSQLKQFVENAGLKAGALEIVTTRVFDTSQARVFQAFSEPAQLALWWGPDGFTNTIHEFDLKPGGKWRLTMRGPDGTAYENESKFLEVVQPERVVFQHIEPVHRFQMVMTFADESGKTRLTWRMTFESADEFSRVKNFIAKANEQNFDRLAAHLAAWQMSKDDSSDREIVITRDFDAPRELVWEAMTNPKHVVNWWGPRGFSTTIETMDFRVGGVWKHVMHGPDGVNYPNEKVFKEIVKPERIVFSHGGKREGGPSVDAVATWTFDEVAAGKTKVTLRMVFPSATERDFVVKEFGAIEGGKQTLERLGEYLPKME